MPFPMPRFLSFLATAPRFSRRKRPARRLPHTSIDFGIAAEVLEDRRLLATFVVNDDGGGDHVTIQAAIDAAVAGDVILINGGTDRIHTEQGITVNKDVLLQGTPGLSQVIVQAAPTQGTATDGVFLITSDTSATIDNLLIRHGVKTGLPDGTPGTPQARGGGIYLDGGALTLRNSTLSQNRAERGGGIFVASGSLTVENSTFVANRALVNGGGLFNLGPGTVTISNSTFSGNSADTDGGGLVNFGTCVIANSTLTANRIGNVLNDGGGLSALAITTTSNQTILISTIVTGNFKGTGSDAADIDGGVNASLSANNLIGNASTSGGLVHGQNGNIVGNNGVGTLDINTVLDTTLRDNGGPTPTHALVSGSPAVNAGLNPFDLPFDQRGAGFLRTQLGQTDIGAVESPFFPPALVPALAFGTGGGIQAQVRVFNSALDEVFRLLPYGDFAGGVRIALGDVTGDGVTDVVTAAGTGGGPHVKVFDGVDGREIRSFFAYDSSFLGGVYVALADLNDDGRADIITGAGEGGGPHVRAFSGLDGSLLFDFFAFDLNFRGGVRVAASDISFDGRPDIITSAGPGGGPHVRVFDGTNPLLASQGINIPGPLGSFFAYEASYTGGVFVAADNTFVFPDDTLDGPFNSLVALRGPVIITGSGLRTGGPSVGLFSPVEPPEYFQLPLYSEARVALVDVNQDGFNDYLAGTGPNASGQVQVYSGDDRGTPLPFGPLLASFFPFGELYRGGIFVAGSI